ncbi:MAG: MaoC family dehydratase N-terminal domain-containing protein [Novosphingobium sp.]|nr:MaoC family dehydratase N-terminal domain-containing protein [Novosphingobium sp.]
MSEYADWIGRSQTVVDTLEPARSNALDLALGGEGMLQAGDAMPLLHHWLYFWDVKPPHGLGSDGHPAKGGFLPPVPLPRRMWAGGRLRFHEPLELGASVTKTSTITAVNEKTGKSGTLMFVTVRHELSAGQNVAVSEEQDLVYREPAAGKLPYPVASAGPEATWRAAVDPDAVLLFRYSALTMNGHRIHYDRPYAVDDESYPALVVHGPLQATLLMRMATRHLSLPVSGFEFRGQQPAFDGCTLHVCGEPTDTGAELWTSQGGARNMVATVLTSAARLTG